MRKLLAAAALLAIAAPGIPGQAAHCDASDIYLFTRYTTDVDNPQSGAKVGNPAAHTGSVGCARDKTTPEGTPNTDYVAPLSNSFSVRWLGEGAVTSAKVKFPWKTFDLAGGNFTGDPPTSGWVLFRNDARYDDSMSADTTAEVTVCTATGCIKRTYRTAFADL